MKTVSIFLSVLLFTTAICVQAQTKPKQRPSSKSDVAKPDNAQPVTKQMATTDEGKLVELSSDGTWKFADVADVTPSKTVVVATPSPAPKKDSILSLEAGLVFKSGDVKPVARTTFHLLDKSLAEILREKGVQAQRGQESTDGNIIFSYGLASKYQSAAKNFPSGVQEEIQKHIIQSTTSDFSGKAKFNSVPQGTYYLMSFADTPKGFVIWDVKVELNSAEVSVTLDQNNAAIAL